MKKLILPLLSLLVLLSNVDARFWTNNEGRSFEGELVSVEDNSVTIRRASDRRKFTMPIKDLSKADQDYIQKMESKITDNESLAKKGISLCKLKPLSALCGYGSFRVNRPPGGSTIQ